MHVFGTFAVAFSVDGLVTDEVINVHIRWLFRSDHFLHETSEGTSAVVFSGLMLRHSPQRTSPTWKLEQVGREAALTTTILTNMGTYATQFLSATKH